MNQQEPIYLRGLRDAIDLIRNRLDTALPPGDRERIASVLSPLLNDVERSIRERQVILTTTYLVVPNARRSTSNMGPNGDEPTAGISV